MRYKLFKIWRFLLPFVWVFFAVHFLKDLTQDILKIKTPLDLLGNANEDISSFPYLIKLAFMALGYLSILAEIYILFTVPSILKTKLFSKKELFLLLLVCFILIYFLSCILLDPSLFK